MSTILKEKDGRIYWTAGMAIDADGSPRAYGPKGTPALDYLANAGGPADGTWYGILMDDKGKPIVQKEGDPYPGMYISPSSLTDKGYKTTDPRRYVDSEAVCYLAASKDLLKEKGVKLGDVCLAHNKATGKWAAGIVADAGPKGKYGEGSIAMAQAIGIPNVSPKNGGASSGITCVIWKGSTKGWPRNPAEVNDEVNALVAAAGGIDALIK